MAQTASVNDLVVEIIDKEVALLRDAVKAKLMAAQNPEAFAITRWLTHVVHGEEFLKSYLDDLAAAKEKGRNLIADKFARLSNTLPPLTDNPRVDAIAQAEAAWMRQAAERYPHAISAAPEEEFRRFVACELETLSDRSLDLYFGEVQAALVAGRNFVIVRHSVLCRRMGTTLDTKEAELAAAEKNAGHA